MGNFFGKERRLLEMYKEYTDLTSQEAAEIKMSVAKLTKQIAETQIEINNIVNNLCQLIEKQNIKIGSNNGVTTNTNQATPDISGNTVEEDERLIRITDMIKILGNISKPTLYRYIKEGIIPKPSYMGGTPLWKKGEVREYLAQLPNKTNRRSLRDNSSQRD
jgi:predicted DNA-binding transcriptional regulator AlpA